MLRRLSVLILLPAAAPGQGADPGQLRGRVGGPGDSAAGAVVRAIGQLDPALLSLEPDLAGAGHAATGAADERGRFRVEVPGQSLYRIWAASRDGQLASTVWHSVRPSERVRLSLLPAGHVTLAPPAAGEPLAWHLWAFDRDRREDFLMLHGVAVRFPHELPALPPGAYRLAMRTRDGRAAEHRLRLGPRARRVVRPRLRAPALVEIRGGQPLPSLRLPFPIAFPGSQPAARDGVWPVPVFGSAVRAQLVWPDGNGFETRLGPLEPGRRVPLVVPEAVGRKIEIRPLDSAGAPAVGRLVLGWRHGSETRRRSIEAAGPVAVAGLPRVEILALFWSSDRGPAVATILAGGNGPFELPAKPGARVELSVLSAEAEPLQRAKLLVFPGTLADAPGLEPLFPTLVRYPDRRGRFLLGPLPPGRWELRVEAPWHVPAQIAVDLASGDRVTESLRLERGYRLHGKVLAPGGKPAAGVLVTMTYPLAADRTAPLEALTDDHGVFRFDGIPDGSYVVEARRTRGTRSELARTRARPGKTPIELELADEDPRIGR